MESQVSQRQELPFSPNCKRNSANARVSQAQRLHQTRRRRACAAVKGCASLGVSDACGAGRDGPGPRQKVDSVFHAHLGTDIGATGSRETPYLTDFRKGETGQLEDKMPLKGRERVLVRRCEVAVPRPICGNRGDCLQPEGRTLTGGRTEEQSMKEPPCALEPNESLSGKLLSNKNI